MIITKSAREIALMRSAGAIVEEVLVTVGKHIKPGVTTSELDELAEAIILGHGATPSFKGYGGFPYAICASVNDTLIHGFPNNKPLRDGDLVKIDVGANYKGYHGDAARTFIVGSGSPLARKLLEVTRTSFFEALKVIKPGAYLGDISHAIQVYVESRGFSLPRDYTGHGIGRDLHEDPAVPNYGMAHTGPLLRPGMTLAIEPMVNAGRHETKVLADGWTVKTVDGKLCAHYENTIVVTESGYDILTLSNQEELNG
ncbi:MAG TPA: type I methionyl aminopeptidase [Bacilli bacterium]|nr:type I methionyl aminopeptidase [Bacilli bacterium]